MNIHTVGLNFIGRPLVVERFAHNFGLKYMPASGVSSQEWLAYQADPVGYTTKAESFPFHANFKGLESYSKKGEEVGEVKPFDIPYQPQTLYDGVFTEADFTRLYRAGDGVVLLSPIPTSCVEASYIPNYQQARALESLVNVLPADRVTIRFADLSELEEQLGTLQSQKNLFCHTGGQR